eukprot:Skav217152  [mRNA]  locus=scaffold2621:197787:211386:- [translate_table: standard]
MGLEYGFCKKSSTTTLPPPAIRLVQTSGDIFNMGDAWSYGDSISGRLEVFYNGAWGTVCGDGFGSTEAMVVCQELGITGGFPQATTSVQAGSAGSETQEILLDDVTCQGATPHAESWRITRGFRETPGET